jgi:histidinol dehydrogenase
MTALNLRQLATTAADFESEFARLRHWSADTDAAIEQRVADILADVQARGDAAVLDYTARFDGLSADSVAALELTREELKAAFEAITRPSAARWKPPRPRAQLPRAPAGRQRPELELPRRGRHAAGPEGHAAGPRGHLRARRQGRLPVQRADERHPRPCGRRGRDHHGGAHPQG